MKLPTIESSFKAGMIYTGLKTILNSVALEGNFILSSLIKYFALTCAIYELAEEEIKFTITYLKPHLQEIITKIFHNLKNEAYEHIYIDKLNLLCSKGNETITQKYQENILSRICSESTQKNNLTNPLFYTPQDNFKAACIILGDQELCSEILIHN